jgi:hypothetical protein
MITQEAGAGSDQTEVIERFILWALDIRTFWRGLLGGS